MEPFDLSRLAERLRQFAADRDWEQFHTPKNLSMALAGEVGELLAELQWLTDGEIEETVLRDSARRQRVVFELADVVIYLIRLVDVLGVNLAEAIDAKLAVVDSRYPVSETRGVHDKRPALDD